uniref:Uncharacterized protein n=1 Tax=Trichobilharzia regenti TaxID=157069 RepID=A0AA85JN36_TRIRE|nr:unnamed protein product [Trichobilharzia regenti]
MFRKLVTTELTTSSQISSLFFKYISEYYDNYDKFKECFIIQVAKSSSMHWHGYAFSGCLVLIVLLCLLLFFKFRNNLPVALILIGIIIVLWSTNIVAICCDFEKKYWCILLVFIILEDLITIIFCIIIKRFKQQVMLFLLSLSALFLITGLILFFVGRSMVSELQCHIDCCILTFIPPVTRIVFIVTVNPI